MAIDRGQGVESSLPGPAREITVEPIEAPEERPVPPAEPPAPAEQPAREREPEPQRA